MRILMFNNEFPPLGGGTGIVNLNYFKVWQNEPDLHIDLITSSRSRNQYSTEPFSQRITLHKVPVNNHNIHHATNHELLRYAWRGWRYARKLLRQHHYDFSLAFHSVPAGYLAYRIFRSHRLPYMVKLEGADIPGFEARYDRLYPFLKPFLRPVWRNAALITSLSEDQQKLAHQFLPEVDLPIVYNGVDPEAFFPTTEPLPPNPVHITCVGRLIERKGQHHLLHAFAQLNLPTNTSAHLTLVGKGDAEPQLRQLTQQLNLSDRVTFTGAVDVDEVPAAYRAAHIFALPSQNESMALGVLEAMATGLPVIATPTGGTRELVSQTNGLIVPWADVPALRDALHQLITQPQRRAAMGQASLQRSRDFTWASVAATYLDKGRQLAHD